MTLPLRVRHLAAGNLYGGVERIVAECAASRALCPQMRPSFAVAFDGRLAREIEAAGLACPRLGPARVSRPWTVASYRAALRALLASEPADAVICHSSWTYAVAAPVVRRTTASLVLWVHDRVSGRPWAERWARRTRPDAIICNSAYTRDSVRALFADVPVEVLYAPVPGAPGDRAGDRAAVRREMGTPADTPVILIACRLEAWKGHRALLEAAARIADPWEIWIAGGAQRAEERAYERALRSRAAALGIEARVRFLGERTDIRALMHGADVHCQPNSGAEPFGLAFVEALHAGLPVVTTAEGGALEILDDSCAVLLATADSRALTDALRRLLHDPAHRVSLGRAGMARARTLCDPARQLDRLATLVALARPEPATA
jgi:glycosyltransferase involved in cell wall biosynthesis